MKTIEQHRWDVMGDITECECARCGKKLTILRLMNADFSAGALRPIETRLEEVGFKHLKEEYYLFCEPCGKMLVARFKERMFPLMETLGYLALERFEAEHRAEILASQAHDKEGQRQRDVVITTLYAKAQRPDIGGQAGAGSLRRAGLKPPHRNNGLHRAVTGELVRT